MFFIVHIAFMAAAFLFISVGVFTAAFRRQSPSWLKRHKYCGVTGLISGLAGFVAVLLAISLSHSEHFNSLHTWVGTAVVALLLLTPLMGQLMLNTGTQGPQFRPWHIWCGRTVLTLMAVNIALGIAMILS
jgi:cytochrome b561